MASSVNVRDEALDNLRSGLVRFNEQARNAHLTALRGAQGAINEMSQRVSHWQYQVNSAQAAVAQGAPQAVLYQAQQNLARARSCLSQAQNAMNRYQGESARLQDLTDNVHPQAVAFLSRKSAIVKNYAAADRASTSAPVVGFSKPEQGGVVDLTGPGVDLSKPVPLLRGAGQGAGQLSSDIAAPPSPQPAPAQSEEERLAAAGEQVASNVESGSIWVERKLAMKGMKDWFREWGTGALGEGEAAENFNLAFSATEVADFAGEAFAADSTFEVLGAGAIVLLPIGL